MSAINFDDLFNNLSVNAASIAKDSLKDFETEANADGQQALQNIKKDLQQWAADLETGAITPEDLRDLLLEDEDLAKMIALKQAGLAQVEVEEFRNNIIDMIVSTLMGSIKV